MRKKLIYDVPLLMKEYFINKNEREEIRYNRREYSINNKCDLGNCIKNGTKEIDFCPVCKRKHEYHLQIIKIKIANTAIMNKVRNAVKRI